MLIGIDLGTTNSAASYWKDGKAHLIPNALGDYLTPSVVSMDDGGLLLTGLAARERKAVKPEYTQSVFKRHMGNKINLALGTRSFQPEELSALILRQLKEDAEIHLGEAVDEAIITVPAYFNDRQRKATKKAGELAGLKVRRLINEPTAAALAYGIIDRKDKEPYLVFDLGGGTFDVSIVEVFDGIIEVRATAGDNRLGGEDFNDAIIVLARKKLDLTGFVHAPILQEKLKWAAERAKRHLSQSKSAEFEFVYKDKQYKTIITEDELEGAAQTLLERLRNPVLRSLRDASIAVKELSEVILVGGTTRMPIVRRAIAKMLGRFPNALIDPDYAVALGAGVSCGLMERDAGLKEVRLTDVSPFTLGIKSHEQDRNQHYRPIYVPLIERSTVLPASRSHSFSTMHPNQDHVNFEIYQGEARQVDDNLKLGEIKVPVPRKPELVEVECRFTYDVSGLLEVDLYVPETNLTRQLVIVDREDGVNEDELQKRRDVLASLKVHPRENAENMALLARGEKCYELLLGVQREILGKVLRDFEAVLERQNPEEIKQERKALTEWLDNLEGERFL